MSRLKSVLTIGGTFVVALGSGLFMQIHEGRASRVDTQSALQLPGNLQQAPAQPVQPLAGQVDMAVVTRDATILADLPLAPEMALPGDSAGLETADAMAAGCSVMLQAEPEPRGMVQLYVDAPCHPDQRAVVHHRGMMFTLRTDSDGLADVAVPALSVEARFIVAFADEQGAVATARLPEVEGMDRAVVQWQGDAGFELHAREQGADYGSDGDVWRDNPRSSATDQGGYLTRLGGSDVDRPLRAEIYTHADGAQGTTLLTVEAEITDANCGQQVGAQSLITSAGARLDAVDLTVTIPDCETAMGDFLILQNLLPEPKLAAR